MSIEVFSYYDTVPSLQTKESHIVIPSGKTLEIFRFTGNGAYSENARVCMVWDYGGADKVLRSTHGDVDMRCIHAVVGDGAKKLAIVLTNQTLGAQSMGGGFEGKYIG